MTRLLTSSLVLLCALLVLTASSSASTINYQGQLNDSNGDPVPDGTIAMTFSLWMDSTGGEMLWQEPRTVSVEGGHFSVYLGQVTPITANIIGVAQYLQIEVEGETLLPRTLLGSTPSTFISKRVVGDVVTDGTSMYLPGIDKAALPKALELSQLSSGGIVSIWGTNGTSIPQVQMMGTAAGGQIGIWGTNGTSQPGVQLVIDNGSGMLNLYPGNEWLNGPDTAIKMSVDTAGGIVSIWGTGGTTVPLVEMKGTSTGGQLGIWGTGGTTEPQVSLGGDDNSGSLGIWGTNGTSLPVVSLEASDTTGSIGLYFGVRAGDFPQVNLEGSPTRGSLELWGDLSTKASQPGIELVSDTAGGLLWVRGTDGNSRMLVYGEGIGDGSVMLNDNAINSAEILDEPGIAQSKSASCGVISSTSTMEDVLTITVSIPTSGYIVLLGHAQAEFSNTVNSNRLDVQLDETSGGGAVNGNFVRIGLTAYSGTSFMDFDVSLQRTYFKSAGNHTFRMEAKHLGSGAASVCFPTITAMFFPTSYGSVATVTGDPGDSPDYQTALSYGLGGDGSGEACYEVDLRYLELKAREARERALEAELELHRARSSAAGMN